MAIDEDRERVYALYRGLFSLYYAGNYLLSLGKDKTAPLKFSAILNTGHQLRQAPGGDLFEVV